MHIIDTVVFDLGNVLINWDPRNLYKKIFSDNEEMEYFLEHVCSGSWNTEQDRGRKFDDAIRSKQKSFPKYHKEIEFYYSRWSEMLAGEISGSVKILKKLHRQRKYRLYALTNWSEETFPIALDNFEFLKSFEGIVVSGREKLIKPDSAFYRLLFNRFDVDPKAAVFIDDSLANVDGAQSVGMNAIHFSDSERLSRDLKSMGIIF